MDEDNRAFNLSSDLYLHIVGCMHTRCGIFVHNIHSFFLKEELKVTAPGSWLMCFHSLLIRMGTSKKLPAEVPHA